MNSTDPSCIITNDDMSLDGDTVEQNQSLINQNNERSNTARPSTLVTTTNPTPHLQHRSLSFNEEQPGFSMIMKFSSASTTDKNSIPMNESSNERENNHQFSKNRSNYNQNQILIDSREAQIQHLSQYILQQAIPNDELTDLVVERIKTTSNPSSQNIPCTNDSNTAQASAITVITTNTSTMRPYPPIHRIGIVDEHDRPFSDYGHLHRAIIAQDYGFQLQPLSTVPVLPSLKMKSFFLHSKSFAITTSTTVSKEAILEHIKKEFTTSKIQYICIGEEIKDPNHQRHVHVQIILKEKMKRKRAFLDEVTETKCHYQVTNNDLAWNEYIKQIGHYLEFNTFKSTRRRGIKQWSSSLAVAIRLNTSILRQPLSNASTSTILSDSVVITKETTTRKKTDSNTTDRKSEKRPSKKQIYQKAMELSERNVDEAMNLIRQHMPERFVEYGAWYLNVFRYLHLQAETIRTSISVPTSNLVWPHSFPDCTSKLREFVNDWLENQFNRTSHAKCLILIGPTNTGKTSFATSLPGHANYFQGRFNLDAWNDNARYSIYDDIPWDDFEKLNFPDKKSLFTQQEVPRQAKDKYRAIHHINAQQPAIVLMGLHDTGSLMQEPTTASDREESAYWEQHAYIYVLGPDEYFYRPSTEHHPSPATNSGLSPFQVTEEEGTRKISNQ